MHDNAIAAGSVPSVELGSIRLWDTGTAWREIETSPGVFDWTTVDAAVENARKAGLRPLLVLGQTPQFHAERPGAPGPYGDGASSMPDVGAWARYVREVGERYGTKVEYQIWNEANVVGFWSGSPSQMARLTVIASEAIDEVVGRDATVVAPAFALRLPSQQRWFEGFWSIAADGKSVAASVDVVSVNLYPLAGQSPEAALDLLAVARDALPAAAADVPVWNTEINYGLIDGVSAARDIPEDLEAAYVARTLLLNAASRVERVYWYTWVVGQIANTPLVEDDRVTLTAGGRAWQVLSGWLRGTEGLGCTRETAGEASGLYTCTARVSSTETRRFYWKPSGPAVRLRTPADTTSWSDLSGHLTERSGRFVLTVGPSPVLVSAGG